MEFTEPQQLALIVVLGISAQWIGWRISIPSILLLIAFGLVAGPVTGALTPDTLFGDVLSSLVSISVGIILFEGGLNLRIKELKEIGSGFFHLVTVGVVITWSLSSLFSIYLLGLSLEISLILGALLTVTGPTVIMPLLRHLRLGGKASSILKWEGIVIDPIGAMLAVLAFELFVEEHTGSILSMVLHGISYTLFIGISLGAAGAGLLVMLLKRYWVPDYLKNAISLMVVILIFTLSNSLQEESGLMAVTIMGIMMANQSKVPIQDIFEFKETLQVLLISFLFIVLSARFRPEDLAYFNTATILFVLLLILVVRPLATFFSTLSGELNIKERILVGTLAPRGIVAAAVAAVFAEKLEQVALPGYDWLTPVTFATIIGTVLFYSIATPFIARGLGLSVPSPDGVLFLGAREWGRAFAQTLAALKIDIVLVDTNWNYVRHARKAGLNCLLGSVFSNDIREQIEMAPLGTLLALTPNDEANSLAAASLKELFGEKNVYQLAPHSTNGLSRYETDSAFIPGRLLCDTKLNYSELSNRFRRGDTFKAIKISEEFTVEDFKQQNGEDALLLCFVGKDNKLNIMSPDSHVKPPLGSTVVALVSERSGGAGV